MQFNVTNDTGIHLTYCTNIHPGESWEEVRGVFERSVTELKRRLSPERPFGVGLRLSAEAAESLLQGDTLSGFRTWLDEQGLYIFTLNGFPYGSFHRERVKDHVYAPDWRTTERREYTLNLAHILAELLPDGIEGGISTSPLSYKPWLDQPGLREEAFRSATRNLAEVAYSMSKIREEQGKYLHLDIEPEPDCLIENSGETIEYFTGWLLPVGSTFLSDEYGIDPEKGRAILIDHLQVCYDTCHFAVEYEEPKEALQAFRDAGIKIGKAQISAALKAGFDQPGGRNEDILDQLSSFDEPTYLHQVIERQESGALVHYNDLPGALAESSPDKASEWRIHFHVPIFVDTYGLMNSTQDDIIKSTRELLLHGDCTHFEIETYTWEVLPESLKLDLEDSIEREFRWYMDILNESRPGKE